MLTEILTVNIFHFFLLFARMSAVFIMFPGISAGYVSTRTRLVLALLVAFMLVPVVQDQLPDQPESAGDLVWLFVHEVLVGAFFGAILQFMMAALHLAGTMISRESGLMNANTFDPIAAQQGAIVIGFLNFLAVVLIFATGLHHMIIYAVADSYNLFPAGGGLMTGDMLNMAATYVNRSFYIGFKIAMPFVLFVITFQVTLGIMGRLNPQMNVFFIAIPLQVLMGLTILSISLSSIMLVFLGYFEDTLYGLLNPGNGNG